MPIKTNSIPPLSANKTKFIGFPSKKTEDNQIKLVAFSWNCVNEIINQEEEKWRKIKYLALSFLY